MDRRRFIAATAATALSLKSLAQQPTTATLTLSKAAGPTIPANFVGLSYETQQLTDPTFFSPQNTGLIALFRALAPTGVLRLGGNTSDVGWWQPTPSSPQPPLPDKVVIIPLRPEEVPFQKLAYSITPAAIRNQRAFLDATAWTCLYGINLATSTPARAAEEAAFVTQTLGTKLEYFQLGNEPDLFPSRFRVKATWTVDAYLDEWLATANAIRAAVPNARFGLPDTSGNPQWSSRIADRLAAMPTPTPLSSRPERSEVERPAARSQQQDLSPSVPAADPTRPHIAAISHHYYFGGPPSNPEINIDRLLQPNPKVQQTAITTREAAAKLNVPYRMTEGNTCYRGGKPGVSDVFASALWAADYLLTLAQLGYAGVNLHGGSGKAVADSLGGTLPGELLMPDPNAPHPRPFYTPIAELNGHYAAQPIYFGMQFAQKFVGATMIPIKFNPGKVNATAYAARRADGKRIIAIINKDTTQKLHVDLAGIVGSCNRVLKAESLTSATVMWDNRFETISGYLTHMKTEGWKPDLYTCGSTQDAYHSVELPPATAVVLDNLDSDQIFPGLGGT